MGHDCDSAGIGAANPPFDPDMRFLFYCTTRKMELEPDVKDSWRHLENALAMVRKLAEKQVPSFVPLVLQMMTGLDDDEEKSKKSPYRMRSKMALLDNELRKFNDLVPP
ncbi:hypothetical protein pipiens_001224 [Culex pipiens pipiens]|uniref:Uncharacterized protein n=1 Tax=Culex pipiens pipiens TaxID=38569 RepID=A0ABD1DCG5_CULPP